MDLNDIFKNKQFLDLVKSYQNEGLNVSDFELKTMVGKYAKELETNRPGISSRTMKSLRKLVYDMKATYCYTQDACNFNIRQFGGRLFAEFPIKHADRHDEEILLGPFNSVNNAFRLFEGRRQKLFYPKRLRELAGTQVDLAFTDTEISVEVTGPRYAVGEMSWAHIERNSNDFLNIGILAMVQDKVIMGITGALQSKINKAYDQGLENG